MVVYFLGLNCFCVIMLDFLFKYFFRHNPINNMKEGQPLAGQALVSNTFPNTYPNSKIRSDQFDLNF